MEACDSDKVASEPSTAVLDEEKEDSCGDLPLGGSTTSPTVTGLISRRCSEFYPPSASLRSAAVAGRQGRRDRRLSDPGRLEVPLLRISLHGDPTNGDRSCWHPGVRLSDPRLDAIRSLLASGPDEVGEALPATAPAPSSSPPLHRAAQSPRSRSPTTDSGPSSKSRQTRWDSRRLSLPNPQPLSSPPLWARRASSGSGAGSPWLPGEMGEAMGAVSGTSSGGEFPTGSPPPRPSPIASLDHSAAAVALRRRRSVSLDQSSRLEAISEENAAAALKARKSEQLQQTD